MANHLTDLTISNTFFYSLIFVYYIYVKSSVNNFFQYLHRYAICKVFKYCEMRILNLTNVMRIIDTTIVNEKKSVNAKYIYYKC